MATASELFPTEPLTCFGVDLDVAVRKAGNWPHDAVAYAVEVVDKADDPTIKVRGEVPVGVKRDGSPKFGTKQPEFHAFIRLSEYRAALGVSA